MKRHILAAACAFLLPLSAFPEAGDETWWRLYFTNPEKKELLADNPEVGLISCIDEAQLSARVAFYEVSDPGVIAALIRAKKRGVEVGLVTDDDRSERKLVSELVMAGIPVVTDERSPFMHNKFAVFDERVIWTGSYNATRRESRQNNNNAIRLVSEDLAVIYLAEFNEMFSDHVFGNRREYTPFPQLVGKYYKRIDGTDINVYFSPEDDIERIIVKRLGKAKRSIHFMAFSFTSDAIGGEMIQKFREGVSVRGIFERRGAMSTESEYANMKHEGIQVRLDRNRHTMHHKVIVIDEELVMTGSYNFTRNASRNNDENIIIINNREIAARYLAEFRKLY